MQENTAPQGELVIQIVAMPADTNAHGDIFGGWLVSHMDMGAGVAGRRRAQSRCVTVAIDKLVFKHKVTVGDLISCYAEVVEVGRTSMRIKIEAWTMGFVNARFEKVAEGIFTFVAIDDKGKPHAVDR